MLPILIRGVIIYIIVIVSVRLMGKRQIGELQPAELVITILLSDIASMPLQNGNTPLLQSVAAIFLLIALEIKPRLVGRKICILCGVYHSVVRIAFENNTVAVTGV